MSIRAPVWRANRQWDPKYLGNCDWDIPTFFKVGPANVGFPFGFPSSSNKKVPSKKTATNAHSYPKLDFKLPVSCCQ